MGLAVGIPVSGSQSASPAPPATLLAQAVQAEAELRFDAAKARLYELLLEHPRGAGVHDGRLRLARLLALSGDLQAAILECQVLRDELPADHPLRGGAFDLATTLARRVRGGGGNYFPTVTMVSARGVTALDEPTAIDFHPSGISLLIDDGTNRAYRISGDTAAVVSGAEEISAAAFLPDGAIITAGKNGWSVSGGKPTPFTGTWGGKKNLVKKVRSMAALANGDVLAIDRDFDGLLRCKVASATCAPWGPPGKVRVVKVGPANLAYLLDDRQQSVRVIDENGRAIVTAGQNLGAAKIEIIDIAVDCAYGLYLLDKASKRVHLVVLRSGDGNTLTAMPLGAVAVPAEGEKALKNPSAIGVTPDGALIVAGRSSARVLRLQ